MMRVLTPGGLPVACLSRRSALGAWVQLRWWTHRVTPAQAEGWLRASGLEYARCISLEDGGLFHRLSVACAGRKAAGVGNLRFERSDVDAFTAPDGTFDAVLGLSSLHLLDDGSTAIARAYRILKPGGFFVSSAVCLGDTTKLFNLIAPIGRFLGVLPLVRVFTVQELVDSLVAAGFAIAHQWQPGRGKAVFIVAEKPE